MDFSVLLKQSVATEVLVDGQYKTKVATTWHWRQVWLDGLVHVAPGSNARLLAPFPDGWNTTMKSFYLLTGCLYMSSF